MTNYVEYTTRLWNQRRTYATFIFYQELKTKTEGLEKTQWTEGKMNEIICQTDSFCNSYSDTGLNCQHIMKE